LRVSHYFSHPRGLGVCQRFGPHSWRIGKWGNSPPLFVLGAHPPDPLPGGSAPWTPLPTPVGFGFASVLGPTRGGVGKGGLLAPSFGFVGGRPPQPPARGLRPPGPPFARPRGLWVRRRLGSHSWLVNLSPGPSPKREGENPAKFSPFPRRERGQGVRSERGTPPTPPAMGASPPGPPFAHPRRLWVCQGFVPLRGGERKASSNFPLPSQGRGSEG
jgi:hypothetical protein